MKITLIGLCLSLVACDNYQMKPSDGAVRDAPDKLRYFHDSRTGLCFAGLSEASSGTVYQMQITNVPCTPDVLRIIAQ
jgi:hypothetical protein